MKKREEGPKITFWLLLGHGDKLSVYEKELAEPVVKGSMYV